VRRVVWTDDMLVCSKVGLSTVIDAISLAEVTSVQCVQGNPTFAKQAPTINQTSSLKVRVVLLSHCCLAPNLSLVSLITRTPSYILPSPLFAFPRRPCPHFPTAACRAEPIPLAQPSPSVDGAAPAPAQANSAKPSIRKVSNVGASILLARKFSIATRVGPDPAAAGGNLNSEPGNAEAADGSAAEGGGKAAVASLEPPKSAAPLKRSATSGAARPTRREKGPSEKGPSEKGPREGAEREGIGGRGGGAARRRRQGRGRADPG
jgi:hypothetical protein